MFRRASASIKSVPAWFWAVLAVAIPLLLRGLSAWHALPYDSGEPAGTHDSDSWLRLLLVREWLQGGGWYDHMVYRTSAPMGGIESPWTRPMDIIVALLVKLQFYNADLDIKLFRAALLMPAMWGALMVGGTCRLLMKLDQPAATYLPVLAIFAVTPTLWTYFMLANADHHGLLAALWVWALSFIVPDSRRGRDAVCLGLILGLMLWISPEVLPLIAATYMWLGLRWLRGATDKFLPWAATATCLAALAALMAERSANQMFIPVYDSISIVHIYALSLCGLLAWALHFVKGNLQRKTTLAALGSAVVFAAIWFVFPLFFKNPMALMHPFITERFLAAIQEAQPLFNRPPLVVFGTLLHPVVAIMACAWQIRHRGMLSPGAAMGLLFFIAVALPLYIAQQRWFYYLYPAVTVAIAPLFVALFSPNATWAAGRWPANLLQHLSEGAQAMRRIPLLLALLFLPLGLMVAATMTAPADKTPRNCQKEARKIIQSGKLGDIPPSIFLVPTNLAPEMLFFTHHRVISGNYHREGDAIAYAWDAERMSTLKKLRTYLALRQVGAIMICPASKTPKNSAMMKLRAGKARAGWLERLDTSAITTDKNGPAIFLVKP